MPTTSLYEQVLADRYETLPPTVRRFHRLTGHHHLTGWVQTRAPATWLARLLARGLGSPRETGEGALQFELHAAIEGEVWTRHFPGRTMRSCLQLVGGRLQERLGLTQLTFQLEASTEALNMRLVHLKFLGLPCPRWLMPRIVAKETGLGEHLNFEVSAVVPGVGAVVYYCGYLQLPPQLSATNSSPQ